MADTPENVLTLFVVADFCCNGRLGPHPALSRAMIDPRTLILHLLVFAVVFGLLYWCVVLICRLLPAPVANVLRVVALVLLALCAISFLLDDFGIWRSWSWGRPLRY
jgi:hypothetical protein